MMKLIFLICCLYGLSSMIGTEEQDERVEELMQLTKSKVLLPLSFPLFTTMTKKPRPYSMFIIFTALNPQHNCKVCKDAHQQFKILAQSWKNSKGFSSKLFFAIVDFDNAPKVFEMMKMNHAPQILFLPSNDLNINKEFYPLEKFGFQAEAMAMWISSKTKIQIPIYHPVNYVRFITVTFLVISILGLLYWNRQKVTVLASPYIWATLAILFIFVMISGQMWNKIRGPPFMYNNPRNNEVKYIAPGGNSQFVAESYIVIALNCAITLGLILIKEAGVPRKKLNLTVRKGMVIVGLTLLAIFFSQLLSIFRSKYQNYPYSFLFK